ncbi:hypothetical protein ACJMK2_035489 [Sinanodonta woodiana]|uniref:Signal recognition particle subunit SRP68 n=1 Tax=Sinanodonta woodiana TaxID=1069815 RepID=A0ABD3WWF9_SINWO
MADTVTGMASEEVSVNSKSNSEIIGQKETFTVGILQITKEAQQQHGLRHGDHQRYRSYCSRRIRRIRKSLHFPLGDKRRVTPKKITVEILKDVRYLHLILFEAERAWGFAMQLKTEANTEPRKKFHMISRLRKAAQHASELHNLCESDRCDAQTKLESQAYLAFIKGSVAFELENWKIAIESYSNAKTIYEKLASAFTEDLQSLYLQRVSEIEPNIRYCAYNIGDESAIKDLIKMRRKAGGDQLSSQIDSLLSQTREKQAATLSEVTWRGRTVPVKNEQVRLFLLNVQESPKEIEKAQGLDNKISIYESLLKQCIDAQQALRDTLQDDQGFKAAIRGLPVEGKVSNQHYLHSYLTYIKLTKTVDRNLLLIDSLKNFLPGKQMEDGHKITKPQDLVRLYDIIIQNLGEVPNISGLEDDTVLEEEMGTRSLGFKAFRCVYIAQSYAAAKKWREAIGLYDRVLTYASQSLSMYKKLQIEAVYKPLIERLDQYVEDASLISKKPNLVHFPPDFEPIPCRPLFFDLALNNVDFPSLEDKMESKKTGGLTGFVKGWLWGGKK